MGSNETFTKPKKKSEIMKNHKLNQKSVGLGNVVIDV